MTSRKQGRYVAAVSIGLLLATAGAGAGAGEPLKLTTASFHDLDSWVKAASGRPNEESRIAGLKAYVGGNYGLAISRFERAAYYADKFSQHYLSLIHWHGAGVAADPVQAYIWADLAAERGGRQLLLIREKMWSDLTPTQQEQVRVEGPDFYARYGDDVAKPRAEGAMRRFADDMTGSRTGYDGQMLEVAGQPAGGLFAPQAGSAASLYQNAQVATREELYGGDRRDMAAYWANQDRLMGDGTVEVGPVSPVRRRQKD